MNSNLFFQWMDRFIAILEGKGILSPIRGNLIVLDGHKSYVTPNVIVKAK